MGGTRVKPKRSQVHRQRVDDRAPVAVELGESCGILFVLGIEAKDALDRPVHLTEKRCVRCDDLGLQPSRCGDLRWPARVLDQLV